MPNGNNEYDVIVVGGGPSGSTSGYILSDRGFRVLIIDKNSFPRDKLCGGLLTLKTVRQVQTIFQETKDSLLSKGIINFESDRYEVFFRRRCLVKAVSRIPFSFVDRREYDYFLLKKAKKAGAEILEGECIISVDYLTNEVRTASGKTFRPKYIIGADGVNSRVRKALFPDKRNASFWQNDLAMALEVFLDRDSSKYFALDHPIIFFGYVTYGYSWIFPNKERIIVGQGGLNRKNRKKLVNSFYSFLSSTGLCWKEYFTQKGHPVPYGNFLHEPIRRRTLLVGDAAGFVDPILGEGIFYAQKSAELASKAISQGRDSEKRLRKTYLELLRKYIYPQLEYSKILRHFVFSSVSVQGWALQLVCKIFEQKLIQLVHGKRSCRQLTSDF